jgi:tetratricopeptide (TPR) repeat protein
MVRWFVFVGVVVMASPLFSKPSIPNQKLSPNKVFQKVQNSIAMILVYDGDAKPLAQGSGVVLSEYVVVTNFHVVENAHAIYVEIGNNRYEIKYLKYSDVLDLAFLVSIEPVSGNPVSIGSTDGLAVGDRVFAIGNPKGLELTLSDGLISSFRDESGVRYIQTTAPISPGSSGGGLFDDRGRLVGLTTFTMINSQNLNFAIPVEMLNYPNGKYKMAVHFPIAEQEASFVKRVKILVEKEEWKQVGIDAKAWIVKHGGSYKAYDFLAESCFFLGDLKQAREAARISLGINSDNPIVYVIMALIDEKSNDWDSALSNYEVSYSKDKSEFTAEAIVRISKGLAKMCLMRNELNVALGYIDKVFTIKPDDSEAFRIKGLIFQRQGLYSYGIACWEKYLELEDSDSKAHDELVVVCRHYLILKNREKAKIYFERLKVIDASTAYGLYNSYYNVLR